jgi:hypothetical protein
MHLDIDGEGKLSAGDGSYQSGDIGTTVNQSCFPSIKCKGDPLFPLKEGPHFGCVDLFSLVEVLMETFGMDRFVVLL